MSDTARFNEAAELPKHEIEEIPQDDGSVRYFGQARMGIFRYRWEEQPVNWVHERWFEHCRHFPRGPLRYLCARFHVYDDPSGSRGEYTIDVAPRGLLGRIMVRPSFFDKLEKTFRPLAEAAREYARGERDTEFDCPPPRLAAGARARAAELVRQISATRHDHGLGERLADYVTERQEVDVWSIRPLRLARIWGVEERHAIEVCLEAVKQGLLRLRWEILCPRCRVGKAEASGLDQLPSGAHCSTCNIDYDRNFSSNVELSFQPARAIRPLEGGEYCLFGPMSTPHIKVQLSVPAGGERIEPVELPHGQYRIRTLEPGPEHVLDWYEGGFPAARLGDDGVTTGEPAELGQIRLMNHSARPRTMIVEEREWVRDALTAKRVTALQAFRDLFTSDVLRPGDDVEIDFITIMFTDLKGSTALYERIGDPQAYHLVREHFALLGNAVREHEGAVVKTIGDAIMAVFLNPERSLACAVRIHDDFERFNRTSGKESMVIKLGIHVGRCISVTLNDRLDYYGTAANMAARLPGPERRGRHCYVSRTRGRPPGRRVPR